MKIIAVTQARIGSTRFPKKILNKINGKTLLELHIERIQKSKLIDDIIIATTTENGVEKIVEIADKVNVKYFKGSLNDVLDRFYQALKSHNPDYVVRLTSDCPLIDAELIDKVVKYTIDNNLDYCSNVLKETYPDGQDIEVFKYKALEQAWEQAELKSEREHVTPYIRNNASYNGGTLFISDSFDYIENYRDVRLTVDEAKDFEVIKLLIDKLGFEANWLDYTKCYLENTEIKSLNVNTIRNEGYLNSLKKD